MEITTLTEIPNKISEFPLEFIKPAVVAPKQTEIQSMKEIPKPVLEIPNLAIETSHSEHLQAMIEKKIQIPAALKIPEEEKLEEDDKDIDKIKNEIMKALSKLEQVEVE